MTLRRKECQDAFDQFSWLVQLPEQLRATNLRILHSTAYTYDEIEGDHPHHWNVMWCRALDFWYNGKDRLDIDRTAYVNYINSIMPGLPIDEIMVAELTPVAMCHGDFTRGNFLVDKNGVTKIIDPGHHRGLPCRELDEAKMMQSMDGWECITHGLPPMNVWPLFNARKIHYVLLLTHYARITRHFDRWRSRRVVEFVHNRIRTLKELLR